MCLFKLNFTYVVLLPTSGCLEYESMIVLIFNIV